MTTIPISIPPTAALYQGRCQGCGASFGVLLLADDAERLEARPRFCPMCCARTACQRIDTAQAIAP